MTSNDSSQGNERPTRSGAVALALRAWSVAGLFVAIALAAVLVFGVHRDGRVLDLVLGVGLVALAAFGGTFLKARAVAMPASDPQAGTALQIAIAGDFVLMLVLFVAGATTLGLSRGGKFGGLEEFGLSFAGAGLIFLVVSAATIAREASRRSAAHAA